MSKFDIIINLGYNCGATYICGEFKNLYKGCSPFDWIISTPKSVQKILMYLYIYNFDEVIKKIRDGFTDDNRNSEFDIWFPHYTNAEFIWKLERRLKRFKEQLQNQEIRILFSYTSGCEYEESKIIPEDIIKVSKLINLFRPRDSYNFVLIENTQVFNKELIENYKKENVAYLPVDKVDIERWWILPCHFKIKEHFGI